MGRADSYEFATASRKTSTCNDVAPAKTAPYRWTECTLSAIFGKDHNTSTCTLFAKRDDDLARSVTVPVDPKGRKAFGNQRRLEFNLQIYARRSGRRNNGNTACLYYIA